MAATHYLGLKTKKYAEMLKSQTIMLIDLYIFNMPCRIMVTIAYTTHKVQIHQRALQQIQ